MDGDSVLRLIFFIVAGTFVLVGTLVKKYQESRQRAERERQRLEQRTRIAPPAPRAVPPAEASEERVQAQEEAERKVAVSPLEQFRRFVQDAQEAQRRQQQHQQEQRTIRTAPPVARPVTPPPARRVVQVVEAEGPSGEEGPSGKSLSEVLAQKDRAVVAEDHAAAQWNVAGRTIVEPASGRSQLAEVLASDRSDLAKAVLMREVLGRPLALRQGGLPISRA